MVTINISDYEKVYLEADDKLYRIEKMNLGFQLVSCGEPINIKKLGNSVILIGAEEEK